MKILYFHQHFSTRRGLTGTRSYEFARALVDRGHQVTMVCGSSAVSDTGLTGDPNRGTRRGTVDGIDVIEICLPYSNHDGLFKRALTFLRFALASIRVAWREKYDLLYATSTPLTAGIPGIAMRLLKPRHKFIFEVRDLWPELPKAMGMTNPFILLSMSVLEKLSYMAMHAGVALSPGIKDGMRRRTRAGKSIRMIPNGCDLDLFQNVDRGSLRGDGPIPAVKPADFCCVFTGAHGRANGLGAVLDAAEVLLERNRPDIKIVLIGDGALKPSLVRRQQEQGLTNCILMDPVPKVDLQQILDRADVGLMILANVPAFYYGTSPNKFFDYLASGLPVLNNYPGWLAQLIEDHHCGVAVPPDQPQAFADALCDLADDPRQRTELGRQARLLAESQFDRAVLSSQWIDFLEDQCGQTGERVAETLTSVTNPDADAKTPTPA